MVASLIPKLDVEEYAKIPRLIHHFYEHSKTNINLDFISFLAEHYQTSHKDNPEHKDLPFVSHQHANVLFILNEIKLQWQLFQIIVFKPFYFPNNNFSSIPGTSLFQPPQF